MERIIDMACEKNRPPLQGRIPQPQIGVAASGSGRRADHFQGSATAPESCRKIHWRGPLIPKSHHHASPSPTGAHAANGESEERIAGHMAASHMDRHHQRHEAVLQSIALSHDPDSLQQVSQAAECHSSPSLRAHHHHQCTTPPSLLPVAPLQCSAEFLQGPRLPSLQSMDV